MADSLRKRLMAGGSWVLLGKVVTVTSNVLVNSLLANTLSTEAFAAYALAFTTVTTAALVSQIGLQHVVVRLVAESVGLGDGGRARAVIGFAYRYCLAGVAVVASILLFGGGVWLSREVWDSPLLGASMGGVAAWTALMSFQVLTSESFRGFQDLKRATLFGGVITGIAMVAALAVVRWTIGTATLEIAIRISAGAVALSLLAGLVAILRKVRALPPGTAIAAPEPLGIGVPLWVNGIATLVTNFSAVWILAAFVAKEEVAHYFAAVRLVTLVSVPLMLVNLIVPPFIAELYSRGEVRRLERILRHAAAVSGAPAFAVLMGFLFFGGAIMELVFTPEFRAGAPVLALLSIGYLVNVWTGSCGTVLSMTGHQVVLMRIKLSAAAASIVGLLLVVGRFGTLGVAAASSAVLIAENLAMWLVARRRTGMWTHPSIPTWDEVKSLLGRGA